MAEVQKSTGTGKNVKVTNKANGHSYLLSAEDAAALQANVHTKNLYIVESSAALPEMGGKIKGSNTPESIDEAK